jgi:glycosyltransferase involved in cell wall biosynthesis
LIGKVGDEIKIPFLRADTSEKALFKQDIYAKKMSNVNGSIILSIVIPTLQPGKYLPALFKTLTEFDLTDCELMVINQGKTPLSKVLGDMSRLVTSTLFPSRRLSAPSARNFGAEHAEGRFVIFLDDDCTMIAGNEEFRNLIAILERNDSDVLLLPKGKLLKGKYIMDWPRRRQAKLGYFSAPKYAIEWNSIFNRRLFLEIGGFMEIGPGTNTAAQCGEILVLIFKLLSKKITIRLFPRIKIAHPGGDQAKKKSWTIYQYNYGHGFSVGHAIRDIPLLSRLTILVGFGLKFSLLLMFPHLQKFAVPVDKKYDNAYVRKNISYVFTGFFDGFSGRPPRKKLPRGRIVR